MEYWQEVLSYEVLLKRFAYKLTGNKEEAGELVQNTLLKLFENEGYYTQGTDLKAWITTVMYNSFVDAWRKKTLVKSIIADIDSFAPDAFQSYYGGNEADGNCYLSDLYGLIEELPVCFQQTFNLFVDGFTYAEIANLTSVPLGTVKSRIYCIRRKLKEKMLDIEI